MVNKNIYLTRDVYSTDKPAVRYKRGTICRIMPDLTFYCLTGVVFGALYENIANKTPNTKLERGVDYEVFQ